MKPAVLKAFGTPLSVENVAEPQLGTGEVTVNMAAAGMIACAREVYSGERKYLSGKGDTFRVDCLPVSSICGLVHDGHLPERCNAGNILATHPCRYGASDQSTVKLIRPPFR